MQCKTKIKNLTAKYKKVKDGNRKSVNSLDSSFVYFMEIDTIRGIYKGCIGTTSSFAHMNGIWITSGLACNRIRSTLRESGCDPDSCECALTQLQVCAEISTCVLNITILYLILCLEV